jgi:addiction module HigA family antidote
MIRSFRGRETTELFVTGRSRRPAALARAALRMLAQINAAHQVEDLHAVPGLRLGPPGSRGHRHEILLERRTVLRFIWRDGDAYEVELQGPRLGAGAPSRLAPVHPGEVLRHEVLRPTRLTTAGLAAALRVPRSRLTRVAAGRGRVSADLALRLARYLNCTPQFWLNLQMTHDLHTVIRRSDDRIVRDVAPRSEGRR